MHFNSKLLNARYFSIWLMSFVWVLSLATACTVDKRDWQTARVDALKDFDASNIAAGQELLEAHLYQVRKAPQMDVLVARYYSNLCWAYNQEKRYRKAVLFGEDAVSIIDSLPADKLASLSPFHHYRAYANLAVAYYGEVRAKDAERMVRKTIAYGKQHTAYVPDNDLKQLYVMLEHILKSENRTKELAKVHEDDATMISFVAVRQFFGWLVPLALVAGLVACTNENQDWRTANIEAVQLLRQDKFAEAQKILESHLPEVEKETQKDEMLARYYSNLCWALYAQQHYDQAIPYGEEAVAIVEALPPDKAARPYYHFSALDNLACAYFGQWRFADANRILKKTTLYAQAHMSEMPMSRLKGTYLMYESCLKYQKEPEEAAKIHEQWQNLP